MAEHTLREQLDALSQYQQLRQQTITAAARKDRELETSLAQLDAAIDDTRPRPRPSARRHAATAPGRAARAAAPSAAGRAVWCHHILRVEEPSIA